MSSDPTTWLNAYATEYHRFRALQRRARVAVGNAVRDRRITKPAACEKCGATSVLHGHHTNYDRLLSVTWLCVPCHREEHRKSSFSILARMEAI